jgi:signal peptidase I
MDDMPDSRQIANTDHQAKGELSTRGTVRELLETALYILLIFLLVRGMVQNFIIDGSSMEPTLHTEQYILVNKLIYYHFDLNAPLRLLPGNADLPPRVLYPFYSPQRGEIVVFEYPRNVSKDYIKRVIGVAGDAVEVRDGAVFVNGEQLFEPYIDGVETRCFYGNACADGPVIVPEGHIFVMGDNRSNSSDSREWDALPLERVIGQAWLIYFPFSDWGGVPHFAVPPVLGAQ